jgi:RNA recognition motif-containing protein
MEEQKNKIFIGNVAFDTDIQTLVDLFSKFGVITDSYKPMRKGFAFITYENDESAAQAIEEMNGVEVDGRELAINLARPREDKPRRDFKKREY